MSAGLILAGRTWPFLNRDRYGREMLVRLVVPARQVMPDRIPLCLGKAIPPRAPRLITHRHAVLALRIWRKRAFCS